MRTLILAVLHCSIVLGLLLSSCAPYITRDVIVSTNLEDHAVKRGIGPTEVKLAFLESQKAISISLSRYKVINYVMVETDTVKRQYYYMDDGGNEHLVNNKDSFYVTQKSKEDWASPIEPINLSYQHFYLHTLDNRKIQLTTDEFQSAVLPLHTLFPDGSFSPVIGSVIISRADSGFSPLEETPVLMAPDSLSEYYINKYATSRQLGRLGEMLANKDRFSDELQLDIWNEYARLLYDSLLTLRRNGQLQNAVDLYFSHSDFITNDASHYYLGLLLGPEWWHFYRNKYDVLSSLFGKREFKRENGSLYRLSGRIIQVLDDAMLVSSDTDDYTWYCTTTDIMGRGDLIDDLHIELYGVVLGTKTYTSVIGAPKTVPWLRTLAIKVNQ